MKKILARRRMCVCIKSNQKASTYHQQRTRQRDLPRRRYKYGMYSCCVPQAECSILTSRECYGKIDKVHHGGYGQ